MSRRRQRRAIRNRGRGKGTTSRRKWLLTWVPVTAAILLVLPFICYYQLMNWLQGSDFREKLEFIIRNKAQAAQVNIPENLSIDDDTITLPTISLSRVDLLRSFTAERVAATIDRHKLLQRELDISKLTMEEPTIVLDWKALGTALPPILAEEDGIWSNLSPRSLLLHHFECKDGSLELHNGETLYSLAGCSISAEPLTGKQKGEWQINIENGRVHTPLSYLQNCSVKSATLLYSPSALALSECRFMLTPGELRARGSLRNADKQWFLELKANKANVARILNNDWKKRLIGELYGELKLTGHGSNIHKATGNLSLREGHLEGLPILSQLCLANTRPYRSMALEKADCRVNYPYSLPAHNIHNAWLFDKIDIRSAEGSLIVRGHVIIGQDRSLHGSLTIGVPESIATALAAISAEAVSRIFVAEGEPGYRWVNINLSGTLDAPQEDISARLMTVLGSTIPAAAAGAAGKAARSASDLLQSIFSGSSTPAEPSSPPENTADDSLVPDLLDVIF